MRRLVLLALLFGASVCAYAGPVEFTFVSWNDGQWQNGYPYVIQETDGPNAALTVMCDDYFHGGMPGQMWEANISSLGSGNISLARFNQEPAGPNALAPLTNYDAAGWLLLQTLVEPSNQYQAMNYAVWYLFDPTQTPCNSACQNWVSDARMSIIGLPQSYYDRVYIITPVDQYNPDPDSAQEFLALGSSTGLGLGPNGDPSVPEPGTLLLLGSGLAAIAGRKFLS
jgi:hypothetical protein